jgi:predicted ATPase
MTNSLDARYNACVADMCTTLLCLDFETIITLLCGSCQSGKPTLNEVKLEEFGRDGFKRFLEFVCRQDHIPLRKKQN